MSIPQMDNYGRDVWRDIRKEFAVRLLKFTIVVVWPAWVALCLSSVIFTPARAMMTGVEYGDVWSHTTVMTGIIFYVAFWLFLAAHPHLLRKE